MKETHVIVEESKEEFEQKLNRFINNGWNIINSNLIRGNGYYYTDKNVNIKDYISIDKAFDINRFSKNLYYALLIKEED